MIREFGAVLARCLATKMLAGLALVAVLVYANATTPHERPERSNGTVECYNHHTAQITIEVGATCPTPVNPYK